MKSLTTIFKSNEKSNLIRDCLYQFKINSPEGEKRNFVGNFNKTTVVVSQPKCWYFNSGEHSIVTTYFSQVSMLLGVREEEKWNAHNFLPPPQFLG